MNALFGEDLANSVEITREAWARRPYSQRLKESVARMWALWL